MENKIKVHFLLLLLITVISGVILDPSTFQGQMFTEEISGNLDPIQPTMLGTSSLWPYPVDVYQIAAMRAQHQFLPQGFPATEVFAYAGKINGNFVPSFPGPSILAFKNTPIYVIYSNNIEGGHILPVDLSPPFDTMAQFLNEVPTVPHAHGLETEMGSDGQPMGFWTKSGRKGPLYFSLNYQGRKPNQAVYRYHNTKEGLFWYHDHTMSITRLNVYAGLVGFYEIVDPQISIEQSNILKNLGDIQRKYFAIVDRTFNTDGSLYYPDQSKTSYFTSWVPQFFGNTFVVNGKVWPKIVLEPKRYRFVFLNGCQSRFLNIFFLNNNKKLEFHLFRRDSDFLQSPLAMKEHLLLTGGRIQIFIDLTGVKGQVILGNSANAPFPMGDAPDQFTSVIMKIQVSSTKRKPSQNFVAPATNTYTTAINDRLSFYQQNKDNYQNIQSTLDFIDQPQAPNLNSINQTASPSIPTNIQSTGKVVSLVDFLNSNDPQSTNSINFINSNIAAGNAKQVNLNPLTFDSIINANNNARLLQQNNGNSGIISLIDFLNGKKNVNMNFKILNVPYPRFPPGKPHFMVLNQVKDNNGEPISVKIDGVGLDVGCKGSVYRQGETYEFYIINLTMDDHPIHMHLINFQVIGRFKFHKDNFIKEWKKANGQFLPFGQKKTPKQVNVIPHMTSKISPPLDEQKLFTDIIRAPTGQVTIVRVKFYNHYGKPFPFTSTGGQYVWHCHILEHQDNQMMRYFCME